MSETTTYVAGIALLLWNSCPRFYRGDHHRGARCCGLAGNIAVDDTP